jgi:ubiquinone/menaquinone biosynthesis C-methylase UbiE
LVAIAAAQKVTPNGFVTGVDMSSGMLKQARSKIVTEGIDNLVLIEADIEAIDFDAEQFDIIFCCSALVYISNIPAILNKCYSWLKPGGCFAFTTPDKKSHLAEVKVKVCRDLFGIDLPHIIRPLWSGAKCRNLLQQSGFKDIVIERYLYSRTKIGNNYESTRLEREFYPRGNPLSNLSEAQKELLQIEYAKAIARLIAERGVWQSANNLYVKAYK